MPHRIDWFFGRGLSIGCGLKWAVPEPWRALAREEQIARLTVAIRAAMNAEGVDTADVQTFLAVLANRTVPPWRHQFFTTNWDFLLQREIESLRLTVQPEWCANTHVYHVNGTVEVLPDNTRRSAIVLETDAANDRTSSVEAKIAFEKMIWNCHFVVVGMSFECEVDKFLLSALALVQDDLPIGESTWIIVNPDKDALGASTQRIQLALPRARLQPVAATFGHWLANGLPELQSIGAISA